MNLLRLHDQGASFDMLTMRGNPTGTKKDPHPQLVEGRTAPIPATGRFPCSWLQATAELRSSAVSYRRTT
jgi:hypothetical protein